MLVQRFTVAQRPFDTFLHKIVGEVRIAAERDRIAPQAWKVGKQRRRELVELSIHSHDTVPRRAVLADRRFKICDGFIVHVSIPARECWLFAGLP